MGILRDLFFGDPKDGSDCEKCGGNGYHIRTVTSKHSEYSSPTTTQYREECKECYGKGKYCKHDWEDFSESWSYYKAEGKHCKKCGATYYTRDDSTNNYY